ncbi:MAG: hypothetical protein QOJ39_1505, partial [Candidatus Eremiobacteraeota bacterium]|nr:hypothetical protein [Candidatus Eremiobacteraeota bacterium]
MGLTFSQLEAVLTPANGALSVAASALLTPAVDTVFGAYLEASTLALTGAVSTPDAARQRVVVTGTVAPGSMLSLQSATLEQGVFALQNDGTVAVLLTVSVADAKWRLSTSFTQLADSVFDTFAYDTPAFTLDSMAQSVLPPGFRASFGYDPDVAEVADELVKGLSFSASLTASGTVGTLFDVLFSAPIPVSGPIETFTHTDPAAKKTIVFPQLLLDGASSSDRTQQIGTYTLTFHFQAASLLQEIAFTDAGVSTLAVLAAPVIAARTTLAPPGVDGFALSAFVYGGATDSLRLGTSANPGNDLDPSKLPALLNGTSPSSVLTTAQGFPALDKLTLKDASIALTLQPLALTSMEIAVGLAQGQTWNVLGIVTFDTLFLRLSVQYSGGTFTPFAVAFASAILANNPNYRLSGYVSMPDLRFAVRLTDTQPLDLTAIVKNLIGDAIPLPSFTLPTIDGILFEVDGDPRASTYTLQAEIEETWTIFGTAQNGLTLGNVTLHLTKATAGVTGSVLAGLDFAGVPLFVSAEYGGSKQWTFSGGTQPGQKVNLATVFQNLASMFGVDQPPDLPEVDLDAFALSYTTSGDPNVQGDFTLKASVSIPGATANLTALPLVGKYLSADDTVTLGDITFDVARTGGKPAVVTLTL